MFKWIRGQLVGKGTNSEVYLGMNAANGEILAAKQVEIPQTANVRNNSQHTLALKRLMRESEILKDLDHPNIVEYLGFEETSMVLSM